MSTYFPNLLLSPLQYYTEANEADSWMNEKAGLAASQDYGKDEDAATKYLKTHAVRVACSVNSKLHIYQLRTYVYTYICMHIRTYTVDLSCCFYFGCQDYESMHNKMCCTACESFCGQDTYVQISIHCTVGI